MNNLTDSVPIDPENIKTKAEKLKARLESIAGTLYDANYKISYKRPELSPECPKSANTEQTVESLIDDALEVAQEALVRAKSISDTLS